MRKAHVRELGACEARRESVVAEQDQGCVSVGDALIAVLGFGIDPPGKHGKCNGYRAWRRAFVTAIRLTSEVDEVGSGGDRFEGVGRLIPPDRPAGLSEQLVG